MTLMQPGTTDFQAVVDVVAYADGTADATNSDGLQRLVDHRKADIASAQLANEPVRATLADPNDADPGPPLVRTFVGRHRPPDRRVPRNLPPLGQLGSGASAHN
jgi:hypothetical protein